MEFCLRISLLLLLVSGTLTQDGFDLSDALDDPVPPTPAKPKEQPKEPEKPGSDDVPKTTKPSKPTSGDSDGFDLNDAFGPDPNPKPDKPAVKPPSGGGGGGSFDDSDLIGVGEGGYKPEGGNTGGGGMDPGYDSNGGADQPEEASTGKVAGIASAIGVALLGAASSYFAYQKKKLCFKIQGGADPEGGHGTRSDPQVFSNLLRTS
ncbi:CD99 molecule isoform X1 [Anoplopoma fimbria]|uniref:CD99 molecule isoform X1 n=1 Tax=Anoplopoma fimbria TaxID=229290 RepID=UPI0023EBE539|nr:CD99 molecule isoform X1 [Anoplopoma fimbria]